MTLYIKDRDMTHRQSTEIEALLLGVEASREISTGVQAAAFCVPFSLMKSLVDLCAKAGSHLPIWEVVCGLVLGGRLLTPNRTSRALFSYMA